MTDGVVRVGGTVRRPHQPSSVAVAAYLDHLEAVGCDAAPRYLGRDRAGRDVLSYMPGEVPGDPPEPWAAADEVLPGVGALLRRLHDASEGWQPPAALRLGRELSGAPSAVLPPGPRLVSHNDVTPQNVVFRGGQAAGLVDFDLAGWTTRLTDLVQHRDALAAAVRPAGPSAGVRPALTSPRGCDCWSTATASSRPVAPRWSARSSCD